MKTSFFKLIFLSAIAALFAVACTNDVIQPNAEDGVEARISAEAGGTVEVRSRQFEEQYPGYKQCVG
jgi:hypothetical protein